MSVTIQIKGLDQLRKAFKQLPLDVESKCLKQSVLPAAKLIRDEVQMKAPVDTGRLERSILIKRVTGEDKWMATYLVVPRHGPKYSNVKLGGGRTANLDAYYWTWVEFGTRKMKGTPFMRPAWDKDQYAALGVMTKRLGESVDLAANALSWSIPV